ncbi:hypothetical protein NK6_7425 [Bradyrhizobium diazoefficiens]|uniref:Uncharacterized protein n=1 Tax=Bradyrhizobium diazoefficiens TaxID=1355477 RepID=A0A0E4BUX3_9BRAD|nr:hypothetical protein NK6_7425 [Bradyrhizobium diazoefficiens]
MNISAKFGIRHDIPQYEARFASLQHKSCHWLHNRRSRACADAGCNEVCAGLSLEFQACPELTRRFATVPGRR